MRLEAALSGDLPAFMKRQSEAAAAAVTAGQAVYLASNVWASASTTNPIDGIVIKAAAAGGTPIVEYVMPGSMIEADLEGTLSASLDPGVKTAILVSDADNVDATAVAGGFLRVLSVDSTNSKIVVVPTKTYLSDTST